MATAKKFKTVSARIPVPQSKADCATQIGVIGELQRQHMRLLAAMNDEIAKITAAYQPQLDEIATDLQANQAGVQTWCEANRVLLCGENDRMGKTANLITGEVTWRQRPPSVRVTGADELCQTLQQMGLGRFVRVKVEPNKDAMLAEPEALAGIRGISFVTGVEDFSITPFEVEVAKNAG